MSATVISLTDRRQFAERMQPQKVQGGRPARYRDPSNEPFGSKYEATRVLSLTEIAKRIRSDIKESIAAGSIVKGVKVSVKTRTYSGGGAIDVRVTALPRGFRVLNPAYSMWCAEFPDDHHAPFSPADQRSGELRALTNALASIYGAYNRDNSDSMTDYFDRRYYGTVAMEWQLRRDLEVVEIERARVALEDARSAAEAVEVKSAAERSPWHQLDLLGAEPVCESDLIACEMARIAVAQLADKGWEAEDILIEHGLVDTQEPAAGEMVDLYRDLPRAAWALIPDTARMLGWRAPMTHVDVIYDRRPDTGAQLVHHTAPTCPFDLDGYYADAHPDAAPDVTRWQSFASRHGMRMDGVAGQLSVLSRRYLARRDAAVHANPPQTPLASAGDLDATIGARAYYAMSHSPDRRAQGDIAAYVAAVNGLYAEMLALAVTDVQQRAADEQAQRYRAGYIRHQGIMWAALARCASPMIVGPARFPTDRNRKRMDAHGRRVMEFRAWDAAARRASRKAVLQAGERVDLATNATPPAILIEGEGVRVLDNRAADRVQIVFADIPDAGLRDRLKGNGWHWSPRNKAWQRKSTEVAKVNAAYMLRSSRNQPASSAPVRPIILVD